MLMYRRVMEKIKESGLDAYLIQSEGNRNYLCHKENYFLPGIMLITAEEVFLATPSRNISNFKKMYAEYTVVPGGLKEIAEICKEKSLQAIGYESNLVSKALYNEMVFLLGKSIWKESAGFMEEIRAVKTPVEIELLQEAVKLSDAAYLEFLNYLKVGMTEKEARAVLDYIFMRMGADGVSFPTLLSSGARGFLPHSVPTDKVIEKGDLVLMDFGVVLNGYCSDTSRTVVMGKASEEQKERYQTVLRAQGEAIRQIHAGMTCGEADALARNIVRSAYPKGYFDYGLGHSVGMEVHELPHLRSGSREVLQENVVVTVEPGIYIEGWGGIRIEDMIVVGKQPGGYNLTTAPKMQLLEL